MYFVMQKKHDKLYGGVLFATPSEQHCFVNVEAAKRFAYMAVMAHIYGAIGVTVEYTDKPYDPFNTDSWDLSGGRESFLNFVDQCVRKSGSLGRPFDPKTIKEFADVTMRKVDEYLRVFHSKENNYGQWMSLHLPEFGAGIGAVVLAFNNWIEISIHDFLVTRDPEEIMKKAETIRKTKTAQQEVPIVSAQQHEDHSGGGLSWEEIQRDRQDFHIGEKVAYFPYSQMGTRVYQRAVVKDTYHSDTDPTKKLYLIQMELDNPDMGFIATAIVNKFDIAKYIDNDK